MGTAWRAGGYLTAAAVIVTGLVGFAAPASADGSAKQVPCPDNASTTAGELDYTHAHSELVSEYVTEDPRKAAHHVYRVSGAYGSLSHYEEFATDGLLITRVCTDKVPDKVHDFLPNEVGTLPGGGGGGAGAYYQHTPSPYHMLGVTTKLVKWKVTVTAK